MIIGIVGAGAVGGYVGTKLASAKQESIFLARGEHLAAMRRSGLRLRGAMYAILSSVDRKERMA